jgi:hypothetical protein
MMDALLRLHDVDVVKLIVAESTIKIFLLFTIDRFNLTNLNVLICLTALGRHSVIFNKLISQIFIYRLHSQIIKI